MKKYLFYELWVSVKKHLQARAFYLGWGISGYGVKMSLCLAGPALHFPLHSHPETAQASENKSIGWNSLQGIFGSSLGNGGTIRVWRKLQLGRVSGCSFHPWIGGEAVGSGGIPRISPGRKHPLNGWWVAVPATCLPLHLSQRFGFTFGLG